MPHSAKGRWFFLTLLAVGLAAIVFTDMRRAVTHKTLKPTQDELRAAFPDATRLEERSEPVHHWLAFAGAGEPLGAVFLTTEVPPDVRGYVGSVPVLVGMDRAGKILRLIVLDNRETPYYMRLILRSDFIKRLTGQTVTETWDNIDAVSGATITSRAIVKDVSTASALVASRIFGLKTPEASPTGHDIAPLIALIISLAIGLIARIRWGDTRIRWTSFIVGFALIGLYLDMPLSFSHITTLLEGDLPPLSNLRLDILLAFVAITTVIWGPVFCGHICPFGAFQEILYRAAPGRLKVTGTLLARFGSLRWIILFVLIIIIFPLGISEAAGFEPYPYLFDELHRLIFGGASTLSSLLRLAIWGYAIVVLMMSAGIKRFWCRIFCPTGSCLLLLSRHRRHGRKLSGIEI